MSYDIIYIGEKTEQWDILKNRYPTAKHARSFTAAQKMTMTKMFWAVWDDIIVDQDFNFSSRLEDWEEKQDFVRVFKNGDNYDGIVLCNKRQQITEREASYRFFTKKKEIDIQASVPRPYDVVYATSYADYCRAFETCNSRLFWVVPSNVSVLDTFNFEYRVPKWEEKYVHVFKNGKNYDGVILVSKDRLLSKNEYNYGAYMQKKEIDIQASAPKPYDVVFISYNEINAEENYQALLTKAPAAKRVHGVKGIHQAHIEAAKQCSTEMFWVVDGDAEIVPEFVFDYHVPKWERDCVHVWRSINPVNGLEYGYGGVKLLPRELTERVDVTSADMTTSISYKFKAVPEVSNASVFNTDAFSAWRSAFRECAKLSSSVIRGQVDKETACRLKVWCTQGAGMMFGDFVIRGALAGKEFGSVHRDSAKLSKINNYKWLYDEFLKDTNIAGYK